MKNLKFLFVFAALALSVFKVEAQTVADEVILTLMWGTAGRQSYTVHDFHTIFDHPQFTRNRLTVIYHYGFTQTPNSPTVLDLTNAYTQRNIANFILVHYDRVAANSITNAREIGEAIGDSLVRLFDRGFNPQLMHLVGFSLGAQIMSVTGRRVRSASNQRFVVGRVSGLDPGQVPSLWLPFVGRLSSQDGAYVDSIHTEAHGFGDHESRGHSFFMVNGGVAQPQCTQTLELNRQQCSHEFAVTAWAESVRSLNPTFPSLACATWEAFMAGQCNSNQVGNMGHQTQTALRGSFFLRTNLLPPWSRAVATP